MRRAISRTSKPEKIRLRPQLTSDSRMLRVPMNTTAPRGVEGTCASARSSRATGGDKAST
ncbi:Uncharacterised protein [Bordetella pertussis]|nr:Uncharacterised protein [Bordetella pertussis]CFW31930.1 Uncharacterised protein [Bordetella pertussis]